MPALIDNHEYQLFNAIIFPKRFMAKAERVDGQLPEGTAQEAQAAIDTRVVPAMSDAVRRHGVTLGLTAPDFRRVSPGTDANGKPVERRSTFGE